jgi:hypothetical protein
MNSTHKAISLYRSLLRAHAKCLPTQMKELGDSYVKSEFRLHKSVTKEDQLTRFYSEWNRYLDQIEQTARARALQASGITDSQNDGNRSKIYSFGADLDQKIELNDEQKVQLENLRREAREAANRQK